MSSRVYIDHINDDVYIIRVNEHEILNVNHDDFDRRSMAQVLELTKTLGAIIGFDVIERDTPRDEYE